MALKTLPPSPGLRGMPVIGSDGRINRDWLNWLGSLSQRLSILSAGGQIFIQPEQPEAPEGQSYWWVQTGLGADGSGFTVWFEDGVT